MKFENTDIWGFEHALRGMRNPKNSWSQSDSWNMSFDDPDFEKHGGYWIGPKDMKLAQTLIKAGPEHRKFLRQIFVSVDITAPLYWWKEFDTYKVGTVANSTSTMHKIHAKAICREDFSCDRMDNGGLAMLDAIIAYLESERAKFLDNKEDRQSWHNMIQILPTSYNQMRTVSLNYENLINIYYARRNHKLAEWHVLCDWIMSLPYAKDLIAVKEEN